MRCAGRSAHTEGEPSLAYQPKIDVSTGELHSVEALLRWNDPRRGPISPSVFVPLAEQAGLSGPIVRWVLDTALSQSRTWQDQGREIPICVNISMYDLRDAEFPDLVAERLAAHGVRAHLLNVEMTESTVVRSTISLGHDLNLLVVAEGVEDEVTFNRLRTFGCDLIQGYLVARPLPPSELMAWIDRRIAHQDVALAA